MLLKNLLVLFRLVQDKYSEFVDDSLALINQIIN
jgi:hypothetical protein